MGIDPGSNRCGFSLVSLNLKTFEIKLVDSFTVKSEDLLRSRKTLALMIGERDARLSGYRDTIKDLLVRWDPDSVVMEHPFMGKFAAAFGVLKEQLMVYRTVIWDYNPRLMVRMLSPTEIKKHMGASGKGKGKDDMHVALQGRKDVSYSPSVEIQDLDEHSVDSACAALVEADYFKERYHALISSRP